MDGTDYEISHVKASPLPVLIPLELKYSPQDPVFKYHISLVSLLRSLFPVGLLLKILKELLFSSIQAT